MHASGKSFDPAAMAIRPATVADAPQLAALRYYFRSELAAPTEAEECFVARTTAWFESRLGQASWRGWAAVGADDRIVGHLFVQFVEKIPNPVVEAEHIAYLTNMYVLPALRHRGLGTRLMQVAIDFCREMDVDTIILWPSEQSLALYQRLGFATPRSILERLLSNK